MSQRWRTTINTVVKTIGSLRSRLERRLSECLPHADRPVCDSSGQLKHYNGWHVFASDFARNNFIKTTLILLSDNGKHDIANLTFDTFYNRTYDAEGNIWYTASIVAMDDYVVRHTIMATTAGTTKASSFRCLMLDIEIRMGALLRENAGNITLPGLGTASLELSPTSSQYEEQEKDMPVTEDIIVHYNSEPSRNLDATPAPKANPAANTSLNPLRRWSTLRL